MSAADDIFTQFFYSSVSYNPRLVYPMGFWTGHTNWCTPFTTTMRVVIRVHRAAANCRAEAHMAFSASFSKFDLAVFNIPNLPNHCKTFYVDQAELHQMAYEFERIYLLLPRSCADVPADRTICPPLPGCISILWIIVPTGIFSIGRQFPGSNIRISSRNQFIANFYTQVVQ